MAISTNAEGKDSGFICEVKLGGNSLEVFEDDGHPGAVWLTIEKSDGECAEVRVNSVDLHILGSLLMSVASKGL